MRVVAVLIAVAAIAAVQMTGAAAAAPKATIAVGNNFFSPTSKTVNRGTKVRFKWAGGRRHDVAKVKGPGGPIESGPTAQAGVNLAKRFEKAGTYRFICRIHPTEMRLKLVVN
jgi:plastocyanin